MASSPDPAAPAHAPGYERRPATDAEARALASGVRLRILRMCLDEALSNREIAEVLGQHPATVLHHVRTLVASGYLEALPPRRGRRGSREIPYRATGKSWYTQTADTTGSMVEALLAELAAVPVEDQDMVRLGLRLPPEELAEFRDRLHALLQEFHDRPRDPQAEPWSLFFSLHPDPSRRQRTST